MLTTVSYPQPTRFAIDLIVSRESDNKMIRQFRKTALDLVEKRSRSSSFHCESPSLMPQPMSTSWRCHTRQKIHRHIVYRKMIHFAGLLSGACRRNNSGSNVPGRLESRRDVVKSWGF